VREVLATVTTKGQITIPVEIRRLLGVGAHDKVAFVVDGDAIWLTRKGSVVDQTAGALRTDRAPMAARQLREVAERSIGEETLERSDR